MDNRIEELFSDKSLKNISFGNNLVEDNILDLDHKSVLPSFFDEIMDLNIPENPLFNNALNDSLSSKNHQKEEEEKEYNVSEILPSFNYSLEANNFEKSKNRFFGKEMINYAIPSKKSYEDISQIDEKEYEIKFNSIINHQQKSAQSSKDSSKLFKTESIERIKKLRDETIKSKEEIEDYLKRKRLNKSKPGRKTNIIKPEYSHTSIDFYNLQVKINNHFLNFLINLSNDVINSEFGKNKYPKFKNIERAFKINVKYEHLNYIKNHPIKYLLSLNINNKYTKVKKNNNRILLEKISECSEWMKNTFFEIKFLEFFNYYYIGGIKDKINIKGKNIFLSKNTKPFCDLINKNKEIENYFIETVKNTYFDGKDGIEKFKISSFKS